MSALSLALLAGCGTAATAAPASPGLGQASQPSSVTALTQIHDPGQVTGSLTGPCHTRDSGQLPDPRCTPGSYDPSITRDVICAPGFSTRSYRPPASETDRAKYDVVEPAYGISDVKGELDHLVPLELGGSNDLSNLWVEAGKIPNPKDAVEDRLHAEVCDGTISLRTAQADIANNWTTAP